MPICLAHYYALTTPLLNEVGQQQCQRDTEHNRDHRRHADLAQHIKARR